MKRKILILAAVLAAPVLLLVAPFLPALFPCEWQKAKNGGF